MAAQSPTQPVPESGPEFHLPMPGATSLPSQNTVNPLPLCVDLDGTLVKSDTLVDGVLVLARQHPPSLLAIPGWIAKGKAVLKQRVTERVSLNVERPVHSLHVP